VLLSSKQQITFVLTFWVCAISLYEFSSLLYIIWSFVLTGLLLLESEANPAHEEMFAVGDVVLTTKDVIENTHDNLTHVTELKESIVLHNLRKRFFENQFSTYIGPILIAMNPYKKLSIYSVKHINQ
jgi:hypothetical protein